MATAAAAAVASFSTRPNVDGNGCIRDIFESRNLRTDNFDGDFNDGAAATNVHKIHTVLWFLLLLMLLLSS